MPVTIDCISDLHGYQPKLDGGDILVIAGDCTGRDSPEQWSEFLQWLRDQPYKYKFLVPGNHDGALTDASYRQLIETQVPGLITLVDQGFELKGLKLYGSPWTPFFCNWHFMKHRGSDIKHHWDMIPADLDLLITHGPPYRILDNTGNAHWPEDVHTQHAGCIDLRNALERARPRHHVFGHIHESGGKSEKLGDTHFHNVSVVDGSYNLVRGATRIVI